MTLDINMIGATNKFLGDIYSDNFTGFYQFTGGTNAFLTQKGANVLTKTLTEVGGFGTVSPLLEGEAPTTEDYLHAGGMILGIKGVNQVAKKGFKELQRFKKEATKEQLVYEATPKELIKVESEREGIQRQGLQLQNEIYIDKM